MSQINETAIRTPGVYTTEIPLLPPSVAQVQTAIPAFIGYTEKAERKGESLKLRPTRIGSLVEFTQLFGGQFKPAPGDFELTVNPALNYTVTGMTLKKMYYLFDALRLFYENGGGTCYIVSVGNYTDTIDTGDETTTPPTGLRAGVKAVESYDEPTLLLFPDAVRMTDTKLISLQQMALSQCGLLQDRFTVLDIKENDPAVSWSASVDNFRDKIGISNLNYGACYTPWLISSFVKNIDFSLLDGFVKDLTPAPLDLAMITVDAKINGLVTSYRNARKDWSVIDGIIRTLRTEGGTEYPTMLDLYGKKKNDTVKAADGAPSKTALDVLMKYVELILLAVPTIKPVFINTNLQRAFDDFGSDRDGGLGKAISLLIALDQNAGAGGAGALRADNKAALATLDPLITAWLPPPNTIATIPTNAPPLYTAGGVTVHDAVLRVIRDLDLIMTGIDNFFSRLLAATQSYVTLTETALLNSHPIIGKLVLYVQREFAKIPPSGPVVGIYALIDGTRGVWKAPANASLNAVIEPAQNIDDRTQGTLNIDDVAGKSINAIRSFSGKGTFIWGARTLDGNNNEWRFISVRRLFIMIEESCKKATFPFVFENNDANTWVRVRAMLENFLTVLWRQGALAGSKPEQAFTVRCGLGSTMTALDILEGRLIIEMRLAAVRPAEFVIIRFMHKLQEA